MRRNWDTPKIQVAAEGDEAKNHQMTPYNVL